MEMLKKIVLVSVVAQQKLMSAIYVEEKVLFMIVVVAKLNLSVGTVQLYALIMIVQRYLT